MCLGQYLISFAGGDWEKGGTAIACPEAVRCLVLTGYRSILETLCSFIGKLLLRVTDVCRSDLSPSWFDRLYHSKTSLWAGVPLRVYMYSWHYHLSGFTALPQKHLFVIMKCVISKEHFSGWLLLWHNSRQFFILVHQLWRVWYACQWRQLAHGRLQCHETRLWVGRETPRDSPHNWIFSITTSCVYYTVSSTNCLTVYSILA